MDLLTKLENALEGIFEGVFSRAFKAPLQPVEVAKRLTREMEGHRTVSVNATYVPNIYTVHLSPETYQEFQPISGRLQQELEQYLRDFTDERHYQMVGPVIVRLAEDDQLRGPDINISVANLEENPAMLTPAIDTVQPTRSSNQPVTALEVTAGEAEGQRIPLTDGYTIGRGPTNALALTEPDVSRRHAGIVLNHETWELRDLGSTNGTFVNERRITSHALLQGDVIRIGHTTILVR